MLRVCFVPQQGRSSALPSLFLAKLAKISGYAAEAMWQLLLEFQSPAVLTTQPAQLQPAGLEGSGGSPQALGGRG